MYGNDHIEEGNSNMHDSTSEMSLSTVSEPPPSQTPCDVAMSSTTNKNVKENVTNDNNLVQESSSVQNSHATHTNDTDIHHETTEKVCKTYNKISETTENNNDKLSSTEESKILEDVEELKNSTNSIGAQLDDDISINICAEEKLNNQTSVKSAELGKRKEASDSERNGDIKTEVVQVNDENEISKRQSSNSFIKVRKVGITSVNENDGFQSLKRDEECEELSSRRSNFHMSDDDETIGFKVNNKDKPSENQGQQQRNTTCNTPNCDGSNGDKVVVGTNCCNNPQDGGLEHPGDEDNKGDYDPSEKWRILRNVVLLSTAFMVHFTAFVGATNLQSSINAAEGLGTVSLASVYATLILSTIFLPVIMIQWLGCKGALLAAFVSYMPYIGAQFSASYLTVMPTAILVGLGGGPFWCAQCMYLCVVADVYSRITGIATEVIVVRFFGIFYMIYEFGQIFGNIISSTVLSAGWDDGRGNTTLELDVRDICGANFCPGNDALANPNLERPSDTKIFTIAGIYLGCMTLSCFVLLLGVDSLSRYNEAGLAAKDPAVTGLQLLRAAGRLLTDRNQMLLVPLTVWLGLEKAVIAADYTASYVSCAWGIRNIGYVMVCYGVTNSLSAVVGGWLVKLTGRLPVVMSAAVLHVAILVTLLLWRPHPPDVVVFFAMAGLWGAADGVWNVQVNAMCGILSPGNEKAAYSSFRLWESVGYILAYGWSAYLCTDVKLYVVLGLLLLGMAGYVAIEVNLLIQRKSS